MIPAQKIQNKLVNAGIICYDNKLKTCSAPCGVPQFVKGVFLMNTNSKLRVALFFGGVSSEHAVSCVSASVRKSVV